jgi:L-ascorbate metabolism protein UlaG (beta-lactamase superfamily)
MVRIFFPLACAAILAVLHSSTEDSFERDVMRTSVGELEITFIGHGTLMMKFGGKTIHIDPWGRLADYQKLPKADLILVTHHHGDHLDPKAIEQLYTKETVILLTQKCADELKMGTVMKNGDTQTVFGIKVEAVPAYNLVHKRPDGSPFHPRGEGNGYVLTFGDTRIYIAGDTENTPEMKALTKIAVAFLPMNLPYTMTPEMVADAAKAFRPNVLYPYHFGETDPTALAGLLRESKGIEVRIRKMK